MLKALKGKWFIRFFSIGLLIFGFVKETSSQNLSVIEKQERVKTQIEQQKEESQNTYYYDKPFVNGKLYVAYLSPNIHPFLFENTWEEGSIIYDKVQYKLHTIKYDIIRDVLVYLFITNESAHQIELNKMLTSEFTIHGKHFKYLEPKGIGTFKINPGYFEVVYDGNTKFFSKWDKIVKQNPQERLLETQTRNFHYLYYNDEYHKIKSRRKLLAILKNHRKELRLYMRNNNVAFSRDQYTSAKEILEYYDSLSKP